MNYSESSTGTNESSGWSVPSPGETGLTKERETKEDGRYMLYYTFEDEDERESRGS